MPDRVQDLTNHRKVAVACKNYTDKEVKKAKDELITFFSRNTVDTDDHTNELAYQITAPSGAKLLQLMSVGGNTVKLSPSVASDSTKAMIKTMPATVYDFDVSKVEGASEVSGNNKGNSEWISGDYNATTGEYETASNYVCNNNFYCPVKANTTYTYSSNPTRPLYIHFYASDKSYLGHTSIVNSGATFTTPNNCAFIRYNTTNGQTSTSNLVMINEGTTALPYEEYKGGYDGIHNLELSGIKVEGANKLNPSKLTSAVSFSNDTMSITNSTSGMRIFDYLTLPAGTYVFSLIKLSSLNSTHTFTLYKYVNGQGQSLTELFNNFNYYNSNQKYTKTVTLTEETTLYVIQWQGGVESYSFKLWINRDTSQDYIPYIQPTTISVDLTSIEDSGGNKLFVDGSIKGNENVKDILGVYNQESKWDLKVVDSNTEITKSHDDTGNGIGARVFVNSNVKVLTSNVITNLDNLGYSKIGFGSFVNGSIGYAVHNTTEINIIYVRLGASYDTAEKVKTFLVNNSIEFAYERATYLTSNTDLSATLRNIQGYPNGSIIAENTNNMDVESVITYNSIIQETLCPSVTVDGANLCSNSVNLNSNWDYFMTFYAKPNTTYFAKVFNINVSVNDSLVTLCSTENQNAIETYYNGSYSHSLGTGFTFTTGNITEGIYRLRYVKNNNVEVTGNAMINLGSTALSYRPYKPSITRNLPTQASDGYGVNANAHNLRVFSDYEGNSVNKRYTNTNKVKLKDYDYTAQYNVFLSQGKNYDYLVNQIRFICSCYKEFKYNNSLGDFTSGDDLSITYTTKSNLWVKDDQFGTDATAFKNHFTNDDVLYYQLEENSRTETDIDDFDFFFDVEEGDIITFNNTYAQQVYATYSFIIKEAKSNE